MDELEKHSNMGRTIRVVRFLSSILISAWVFSNVILDAEIDFLQFSAQLIFIVLIVIWDIGEPWIYRLLMEVGDCFPGKEYKAIYENYKVATLCYVLAGDWVQNAKKAFDTLYCITWLFFVFFTGILVKDIIPCWTCVLLLFYSTIALISTYRALVFLLLLYSLSRVDVIAKLEYNRDFPSATYGFCKLTDISKTLARTFLTIMLLFTIAYALCITPGLIATGADTHRIIQIFWGVVLLGWLVQFALAFVPKQYFRKILLVWSYEVIKEKQERILAKGIDNLTKKQASEEINNIHSALKAQIPIFEFTMGILTLTINICGILLSICI